MLAKALLAVGVAGALLVVMDVHPDSARGVDGASSFVAEGKRTEMLLGQVGR